MLRIAGSDGGAIAPTDAAFVQALNVAFSPGGPVDKIDAFNLICVPGLADAAATAMLQAQAAGAPRLPDRRLRGGRAGFNRRSFTCRKDRCARSQFGVVFSLGAGA